MDKQAKRILVLVFFTMHILAGCFLLFLVFAPELVFHKPDEQEIEEKIEYYEEKKDEITEERLIIPIIRVDMAIGERPYYLDFGGWIQEVNNNGFPQVIAVHRFGWDTLTPDQKINQTLYHVDKLSPGDQLIILWDGKKTDFTIKEITTSTNNPSIKNDELVIYTCKFWNSSERVFVIATPNVESQNEQGWFQGEVFIKIPLGGEQLSALLYDMRSYHTSQYDLIPYYLLP